MAVAALVAAGAGVGAWYYFNHGSKADAGSHSAADTGAGSQGDDKPTAVEVVHIAPGGIEKTSTQIGTVLAYEEADLYAKVSGYLAALHVDYGDHVKREQLLAEIDDPEVVEDAHKSQADVLQAEAAVVQAEAFIESAKAEHEASSTSVDQAIAEVDRYKSMRSYHEKKRARYKDLVERKAIPQQIADEEEESYESARASEVASQKAVLNSRAQLTAAAARVKKAEADMTEAKANVEVMQAKLARAKVFVGYTKIYSPYDGVVTKRNFFRGAFIRSASEGGMLPLLTVARTDKVRVATQIPDRDVHFTDVGDPAEVTLDALVGEVFRGKVSRFADAEDPTTRTMYTEIDLPNSDHRIRVGMYGIAKILLDTSTKSATLPDGCLTGESKEGKADVYVIKKGKAKKTEVKVGTDDGLRVEILSGLTPGDEVIASPGSVTEGAPVRGVKTSEETGPAEPATAGHGGHEAGHGR